MPIDSTMTATVCPKPMQATSDGIWQGDNPLDYALPLAILQIVLVVAFTRLLAVILKPLRQPRVIAEIIGGILLGPSAFGRNKKFLDTVFPEKSMTVLDTLANIGLLFFLFLVGLELDIRAIRHTGNKALAIAVAGICLPFALGVGTSIVLRATIAPGVSTGPFLVFMGVSLSITAFPVLARILAELKLLTTDVGRMAMSAAAVNDVAAWILLALAIALSGTNSSPLVSLWVLLSCTSFLLFAIFALRPGLALMARRSPEGEPIRELYICATLSLVLAAGFITDLVGVHSLFGAFIVGIIVPKDGPFANVLIEKVEDIVSGLLLPLYFVSSGLKTNVATVTGAQSWGLLVLVIFTACFGKIVGTMIVSLIVKVPCREAITLGFLMNTKGLVELIVLNIGKDRKVLNDQTFTILVLMALFNTFITTPIVTAVYKPARQAKPYMHRTIQRKDLEAELRILACFHSTRNIVSMINLFESSRGIKCRGVCVYAMHLMELSERSSAISMVHKAKKNGVPFWNKKRPDHDHIVIAFQAYQQLSSVSIRSMTAISPLHSIHEDICTSAEEKNAAIILLPFHKHQRLDGTMESLGHSFHIVNQRVLQHAPCSVGILVDRGLGGATQVSSRDVSYAIKALFFGGCDDREAVSYGARMAEHPGIVLILVRFLIDNTTTNKNSNASSDNNIDPGAIKSLDIDEKRVDDEFLSGLKSSRKSSTTITFEDKVVRGREDIVGIIDELNNKCSLFLVGRMPSTAPPLLNSDRISRSGSANSSSHQHDSTELGPVGSYLTSSEFTTSASVLVIQQYNPDAHQHDHQQATHKGDDVFV